MKLKHTHRTDFVRDDYQLAALHVILIFNGKEPTPREIENFEEKYRGHPQFEEALGKVARWLQKFQPDFKAEPHDCGGQMCDQDGTYQTELVTKKEGQDD